MKKNTISFLLIFLMTPLFGGCWNQEELTDLAFVMAVGIDKAKNNKGYQVTYEIVNPGNVASSQMGGGQGAPVAVYQTKGETLLEATRKASKELSRHIYYAHTNAIVISEEIAREGILKLLDFYDRDPVFRTTTQLFIARKASAENVVSTLTILDKIPVNKLVKSLEVTETMLGENTKINIEDFLSSAVSNGKEPIANGVILPGNKSMGKKMSNIASDMPDVIIKNNGIAIFKEGKLIGWIEGEKARGVIFVMNKIKGTDINVDWHGKKKAIGIILRRSKTNTKVVVKNGKPAIKVIIHAEGDIDEADTAVDLTDPRIIQKIEGKMSQVIKNEVYESVKLIQRKKSDIFGFGEAVHRENPKLWTRFKKNWNEQFSTIDVSVNVDAFVRRNGIRTKSFWSTLNQ